MLACVCVCARAGGAQTFFFKTKGGPAKINLGTTALTSKTKRVAVGQLNRVSFTFANLMSVI